LRAHFQPSGAPPAVRSIISVFCDVKVTAPTSQRTTTLCLDCRVKRGSN
jgi:hypothetical protein